MVFFLSCRRWVRSALLTVFYTDLNHSFQDEANITASSYDRDLNEPPGFRHDRLIAAIDQSVPSGAGVSFYKLRHP